MNSQKLFDLLKSKDLKITFAESMTGGFLTANLVKYPGASQIIKRSFIVYSNEAKEDILKVSPELIRKYGVVSREVAEAMNEGLQEIAKADIYCSITGNAGPTYQGEVQKQVAYVAIKTSDKSKLLEIELKTKSRLDNINLAIETTFKVIIDLLE
ncbi:MAG: CinA family protein [Acholeplasmataceae bacterium]